MTVYCNGIAGRPCCNETLPAAGLYTVSKPLTMLCMACAKALPTYVKKDSAPEQGSNETDVQVRVVTRAPFAGRKVWTEAEWRAKTKAPLSGTFLDIELLEGTKWRATMSDSFTRALLDIIPLGC